MEDTQLFAALLELADEVGLRVDRVSAQPAVEGGTPGGSAVCRLRGQSVVFLSNSDPWETRIGVLALGLRTHAGSSLEERFLPPAVRACLEAAGERSG